MDVKLIAKTVPVSDEYGTTILEFLTYCARVSNPDNQSNFNTSEKLIKFLMRSKHWSPFEMASLTIKIETSRDMSRELLRHRSFSFQEFSQRYAAVVKPSVYRRARLQDHKNRQNSIEIEEDEDGIVEFWYEAQREVDDLVKEKYEEALDRGIAKEVSRTILPEGMTPTVVFMAGPIRSWVHFVEVRTDDSAQKEVRDIAGKCKQILNDLGIMI